MDQHYHKLILYVLEQTTRETDETTREADANGTREGQGKHHSL